jgi:hypothetical protein
MKICGIDPGLTGAAVIFEINEDAAPQFVAAIDMPVVGLKAKQRLDAVALRDWLVKYSPQHVYVERGQSYPAQGSSSGFKYGVICGGILATVACSGAPLTVIEPSQWKRFHGLHGSSKEPARSRALELVPTAHAALARRRDHSRGDSILLALYGARAVLHAKPVIEIPVEVQR